MSGLAGLLAGHTPADLYLWHGAFDVADVRHTVENAGWGFAHVDLWTHQDGARDPKSEFLAEVGRALDFPGHYGHNFDALADCLADVGRGDLAGTVLLWDGWGVLARSEPQAFSVALSVLGTRVHGDRGTPFAVLLRGDGPAQPELRSLD